jgi:hypothetical protein
VHDGGRKSGSLCEAGDQETVLYRLAVRCLPRARTRASEEAMGVEGRRAEGDFWKGQAAKWRKRRWTGPCHRLGPTRGYPRPRNARLVHPNAFPLTEPISVHQTMASDLCLPGQPIPIPRGPAPAIGSGIYSRDGQVRASVVGVPRYEGSVGYFFLSHGHE